MMGQHLDERITPQAPPQSVIETNIIANIIIFYIQPSKEKKNALIKSFQLQNNSIKRILKRLYQQA